MNNTNSNNNNCSQPTVWNFLIFSSLKQQCSVYIENVPNVHCWWVLFKLCLYWDDNAEQQQQHHQTQQANKTTPKSKFNEKSIFGADGWRFIQMLAIYKSNINPKPCVVRCCLFYTNFVWFIPTRSDYTVFCKWMSKDRKRAGRKIVVTNMRSFHCCSSVTFDLTRPLSLALSLCNIFVFCFSPEWTQEIILLLLFHIFFCRHILFAVWFHRLLRTWLAHIVATRQVLGNHEHHIFKGIGGRTWDHHFPGEMWQPMAVRYTCILWLTFF